MLWSRYGGRYRIHDCLDIIQHGTPLAVNWEKASRCDRYDDAQTDAVQVIKNELHHLHDANDRHEGTKDTLALPLFWVG